MGRYYHIGKFMQVDVTKAIVYLKAAAAMNNLAAQMRLANIYHKGYGSPLDYPELYSQLHHAVTGDKKTHKKISQLKKQLASKMPAHVVDKARKTDYTN